MVLPGYVRQIIIRSAEVASSVLQVYDPLTMLFGLLDELSALPVRDPGFILQFPSADGIFPSHRDKVHKFSVAFHLYALLSFVLYLPLKERCIMDYLSDDQLQMLIRCQNPLQFQELSDSEKAICRFLAKQGLVTIKSHTEVSHDSSVFRSVADTASITENGKSYLSTAATDAERYKKQRRLDIYALIIAGIALAVSIAALIKSFL